MNKKIKRNIVLVCPGGAMAGIFGGGVFTAFEEADLYPQIKIIYAGSAGALNSAYFLSHQIKLGATVYLDDLTGDKFIKPGHVPLAYWQRLIKYIKKDPEKDLISPIDLDYLFNIIKKGKKKLDIEKVLKSKIEFNVAVTRLKDLEIKIFNGKTKNILKLLKASANLIPYYSHSIELYRKRYIDGMIIDPILISSIIKKLNPKDKVIVINNTSIKRNFLWGIKSFLEGMIAYCMFRKDGMYKIFAERDKKFKQGLKLIKRHKNIFLISAPNDKTIGSTTDREKLLATYNFGIKKGKKFLKKHKWIKI